MIELAEGLINILEPWDHALRNAADGQALDEVETVMEGIGAIGPARATQFATDEAAKLASDEWLS